MKADTQDKEDQYYLNVVGKFQRPASLCSHCLVSESRTRPRGNKFEMLPGFRKDSPSGSSMMGIPSSPSLDPGLSNSLVVDAVMVSRTAAPLASSPTPFSIESWREESLPFPFMVGSRGGGGGGLSGGISGEFMLAWAIDGIAGLPPLRTGLMVASTLKREPGLELPEGPLAEMPSMGSEDPGGSDGSVLSKAGNNGNSCLGSEH